MLKDVTSNKNQLYELSIKVKVISTKGLTIDAINSFSILNGAKTFSSAKRCIKYFSGTTWIDLRKSNEMSEEIVENIRQQFFTNIY